NVIEIAASSRAPWQLAQSIRPWAPTRAKPVWASWSNRSASNELLICCQPAVVWHVAQSVPKAPSWASSWHDWQEACSTPSNWRRGPLPGWQLAQAMAAWAPVSGKPVRAWLKLGVVPHVALPWHEEHSWPRNWPPWGLSSAWQPRQLVERPSKRAAPRPASPWQAEHSALAWAPTRAKPVAAWSKPETSSQPRGEWQASHDSSAKVWPCGFSSRWHVSQSSPRPRNVWSSRPAWPRTRRTSGSVTCAGRWHERHVVLTWRPTR